MKEIEKLHKYMDFVTVLKNIQSFKMKVTVIKIVLWALGTVPKNLEKEIGVTGDEMKNQNVPTVIELA